MTDIGENCYDFDVSEEVFQHESIDFKLGVFEISLQVSSDYLFKVTIRVSDSGTSTQNKAVGSKWILGGLATVET